MSSDSPAERESEEQKDNIELPAPLHLGAVHQVYPEQNFALLRMLGPVPAPGTTLISHPADGSADRVGNLCVSYAAGTRHNIIAADIRSGTVVQGDRVFLYREIAAPEAAEQETPETEDAAGEHDSDDSGDDTMLPTDPDTVIEPDGNDALTPAVPEPASVETTVLPEETPDGTPTPTPQPETVPDSLQDIPDTLEGWDSV